MKIPFILGKSIPKFKFDLKMKLTIYLFLISLFQIHANSYSQNAKISIELSDVSIENVLRSIESKSEFKFLYNSKEIDYKKLVSVNFKKTKIRKILEHVFYGTDINFEVLNKQIILILDKTKNQTSNFIDDPQQIITGTVIDESGVPVAGANILVKGTTKGAVTDFDGKFSITASSGDVLEVSYVGYVTQSITLTGQNDITITITEDAALLDEVVVIGYGTAKRSDITEAVTQVTSKSFEEQPVIRVEEALQGRTAGVTVARSNGSPGAGAKIRVRGVNSITGNNAPLVVIDGFIGGDLRTLNPADIESFDVLKDASATAIYGSRGANGVILITTKKGKGKTKVEINSFGSISELAKSYENRRNALEHYRLTNNPALFPGETEQSLIDNPVTDREDELFRTAYGQNHQISISGGQDGTSYFVSGNYTKQEGIMTKNLYERYSLRANVESKINDKLKVGVRAFYNRELDFNDPNSQNLFFGGPVVATLAWDPTFRMFNPDGSFNYNRPQTGSDTSPTYFVTNLLRSSTIRRANRFNTNINVEYKFTPEFTYTLIGGVSVTNQTGEGLRFQAPETGSDFGGNVGFINTNEFTNYQISNLLNWNKTFNEKHEIDVLGVYEFTKSDNRFHNTSRNQIPFFLRNITDIDRFEVGPGENPADFPATDPRLDRRFLSINTGFGESAIISFLGRAKYTFNRSLSVSASVRRDETTAFTKDNRVGVFKSFSVGYNFNNLGFIQNSDAISSLKLRASWGETGNQNAPRGAFEDAFTPVNIVTPTGTITIQKQTVEGNPDLTWETTEQANIGLDVGFLNGRINLTIDAYQKDTKDLIVTTLKRDNVPGLFITENVGDVQNKGVDIVLNADVIKTEDFKWNSTLAFSYLQNEVVRISPRLNENKPFVLGSFFDVGGRNIINVIKEGEPLGAFWGTRYLGTNPDGTANIDNNRQVIGSGLPTTTWGLNNTFNYKNWDFNLFLQGSHGFEVFNQVEAALAGGEPNFRAFLKKDLDQVQNVGLNSSRYVEDGSFIRLSNLSLGYTFNQPTKGFDYIKIYASGQNLFLITDYKGYDPEVSSNRGGSADQASGIDAGAVPNPRLYTLGVKIGI